MASNIILGQALGRKRCAGEMSTGPEIKTKGGEGDLIQDLEKAAKDLGLDFTLLRYISHWGFIQMAGCITCRL